MEVLHRMGEFLDEPCLLELRNVLNMVFLGCRLVEETSVLVVDHSWRNDLDDFLMAKSLEGRSNETVKHYKYELTRLLSYTNKSVSDISSSDILAYLQLYKSTRRVTNQTLKNVRAIYSSFFAWLRDRDRIGTNPMILVDKIKTEKVIQKPFTDEERERIFQACDNLRDRAIVEFLYSTAVRVSELSRINRADVCLWDKTLFVYGKGAKERRVYLNEVSSMYLRDYLNSRTDDSEALFVSLRKPFGRLTKGGIESLIRTLGKRAGVQKAHPHRFRRTSITNVINRGMKIEEAMIFAGHSKPETTMRYCTVDEEAVQYHHKIYLSS